MVQVKSDRVGVRVSVWVRGEEKRQGIRFWHALDVELECD